MHKPRHIGRPNHSELPVEHRNTYEEWRVLLDYEKILKDDGTIDLVKLELKYPKHGLDEKQLAWIEAMQQGRVTEEGEDVDVSVDPIETEPMVPEVKDKEEEVEVIDDEAEEDDELAPPPPPGEQSSSKKIEGVEKTDSYAVGDTFKIQVAEDGEPEEVTIAKIAKDGIHLASSKDEDTEYLVDAAELKEMIVE